MKPKLALFLSFLLPLIAFFTNLPLAFSDDGEQVVDKNGNPIIPGLTYYILPSLYRPFSDGGLKLAQTGNSDCPLTVLQDDSPLFRGLPVKFTTPGVSSGTIFTGTKLEIEFVDKSECSKSSKWLVFLDKALNQECVGIGGVQGHPTELTYDGKFQIEGNQYGYKLAFCVTDPPICLHIGKVDAGNHEGGKRLILTEFYEEFYIRFVEASAADKVMKSVV